MGEIIQLKPKSNDEIKASIAPKEPARYCSHKYVEVDKDQRVVNCTQCFAVVEPFDFLWRLACEERNQIYTLKELKRQIDQLREEKDRLQKDVTNLKASKRRIS